MSTWEEEAKALPPPTPEEIEQYADGLVHHQASDGTLLEYNREKGIWERALPG